jgi:HD superfamily phosphohydrolase
VADRRNPFLFEVGEMLGDSDYQLINKDGSTTAGRAKHVDAGGAGVVYRTLYKGLMPRAVKLLAPRPDLLERLDRDAFERTFTSEIAMLARVTHTRIAKIVDYGELTISPERVEGYDKLVSSAGTFFYYAMDFIDGRHLDTAFADPHLDARSFLGLIDEILDAVAYLHGVDVMHADLKEENILVRKAGTQFSATVVDLGVAKTMKPPEGEDDDAQMELGVPSVELDTDDLIADSSLTLFFSSPKIVRDEWKALLRHPITRGELRELFPGHDLYAIGLLIQLALDQPTLYARLERELGSSGLHALVTVRDRLLAPLRETQYYDDAEHLRRDWTKLDPGYLSPLKIGELAIGSSATTSIATPAGRVSLTERLVATVNHPLVQRLRHLPQLELASLVYPGATHTRLLHAFSTFDTARRFISHLMSDPAFRLMVEPIEIEATLLRALIHDIGHFPLSHMFEDFAEEEKSIPDTPRRIPTDDDLFWSFVDSTRAIPGFEAYGATINEALKAHAVAPDELPLHEHLVHRAGFSPEVVAALALFDEPQQPSHAVLAGILSSPVDVDKVSYLYDDSAATGVRYGLGMDLDALLPSLRAPREADIIAGKPLLAIDDKGLPAAEGIVLARYWMLKRVYWHHTNRAVMAMVKFSVQQLLATERIDMLDYFKRHLFCGPWQALDYLSAAMNDLAESAPLHGRQLRNPLPGLIGGNRYLYKRVATIARGPADDDRELYDRLAFRSPADLEGHVEALHATLERFVQSQPLAYGDVLIDVPTKRREQLGGPVVVYLQRDPDHAQALEDASPLLGRLREEYDQHVKKCRVFVHPDVCRRLKEVGRLEEARSALRATLRERVGLSR